MKKLTPDQVHDIYFSTKTRKELCSDHDCCMKTIYCVQNKMNHRSITRDFPPRPSKRATLTTEQVVEIYQSDSTNFTLAKEYDVCPETIRNIKSGRSRASITEGLTCGKVPSKLAVLTPEQVVEIYQSPDTYSSLATKYGVHIATIMSIVMRKTWKKVTENLPPRPPRRRGRRYDFLDFRDYNTFEVHEEHEDRSYVEYN